MYRGVYFEFLLDEAGIIQFRKSSLMLVAVIIVLHILGGFVNSRGMYQFYVALPYVVAFFPLLYLAVGVLRLPKEKRKFRRDEIGLSFDRMKISNYVLLVFLGLGVLGEITFLLFFSTSNQTILDILYLAIELTTVAAVYLLIQKQRKIPIQTSFEELQS